MLFIQVYYWMYVSKSDNGLSVLNNLSTVKALSPSTQNTLLALLSLCELKVWSSSNLLQKLLVIACKICSSVQLLSPSFESTSQIAYGNGSIIGENGI